MTPWQVAKTMKARLDARAWPGVGGLKVFGAVRVVAATFDAMFRHFRTPSIAIRPASATSDEESQQYLEQRFELILVVMIAGDEIGENAVTGANRTAGQAGSQGRGLLEVEEEMKAALAAMVADGFRLQIISESDGEGIEVAGQPWGVYRSYTVSARCTSVRYYHPPRNLVATASGGGAASLSWTLPPDRYDRRRMIVRRAAGSTPPAGPTSGVDVPVAALATSVVDSPGVGTFSYAIFSAYTETEAAEDQRFSDQETGTTRTLSVT